MFQIIELDTGRYVIRNLFGGYVNKDGIIKTFRSSERAEKHIQKMCKRINRSILSISKRPM